MMNPKKHIFAILLFLCFATYSNAQDQTIQFQEIKEWNEVLPKAKKENKIIFAYAYYPCTCCLHCVKMEKEVFSNDSIARFYNENFICVKLNLELPENRPAALKYPFPDSSTYYFPTLLYIDPNGKMVYRSIQSQPAKDFFQDGKNAMNPEKQIPTLIQKLKNGIHDPNQLYNDLSILKKSMIIYSPYLSSYFDTQKEEEFQKEYNWKLIQEFTEDIHSKEFNYVLKNNSVFEKLYSKQVVESFLREIGMNSIKKAAYTKDENVYQSLKKEISIWDIEKEITSYGDMIWYKLKKDWNKYANAAIAYSTYITYYEQKLNEMAQIFYKNIEDKKLLTQAKKWSKHSIELENNYINNDTYAHLLYKLGKKKEAKAAVEKAIELGKKENQDYKETEELLKKLN